MPVNALQPMNDATESGWSTHTSSGGVFARWPLVRFDAYRARFSPDDMQALWTKPVLDRIDRLLQLQLGWDSYGAPRITYDAGMFALLLLNKIMGPRTPAPSVVPSPAGGVQLEWHQKGIDLEVHVMGPYHCEFSLEDLRGQIGANEGQLVDDFSALADPIAALTIRV